MLSTQEKEGRVEIPGLYHVSLNLANLPDSAPRKLQKLAQKAEGLSGRTLRRLPILALTKYTDDELCDVHDLLEALKQVITEEKASGADDDETSHNKSAKQSRAQAHAASGFQSSSSVKGDADADGADGEEVTSDFGSDNMTFSMDSLRDSIIGTGLGGI